VPNAKLSGNYEEYIPMIICIGLNYEFSKKVFAVVDIEKNIELDPNLKIGIEYHPIEALYFRGGINTYDFNFTGGLGVKMKKFNLDIGVSQQTYLGIITNLSLSYSINKK
jgi:hypothetical protein